MPDLRMAFVILAALATLAFAVVAPVLVGLVAAVVRRIRRVPAPELHRPVDLVSPLASIVANVGVVAAIFAYDRAASDPASAARLWPLPILAGVGAFGLVTFARSRARATPGRP